MNKSWNIWLFFGIVLLVPFTMYGVVKWYENSYQALPVLVAKDHTIAPFALRNQNNAATTLNSWNNKIVIADFFFTHCPSICPKMTQNLKRVQQAYAGDNDIMINSFSVDPERDSAARLKAYAERFAITGANWNLLTGDKKEIYRLARKSFFVVATDGDGGPNDFIHSDQLVLVDPQKQIRGYYDGTNEEEVNQLIKDIKKLKHEN